jgi:hypothetical protein
VIYATALTLVAVALGALGLFVRTTRGPGY